MSNLAVIVLSKTASNLVPCIAAMRKHEPEARIIVVDDGVDFSMDFEGPALRDGYLHITQGAKPFVFSRNVNLGILAAGDDDVVLLNDDAILESPGGFSLMQRAAAQDERVGIIGAVTDLTGQPHQRRTRSEAIEKVARNAPSYGLRAVDHIAFVCVYIPRRTINALAKLTAELPSLLTGGYLDERYCAGYGSEDLDYCMQCRKIALCVCVHDGCFVNHSSLHSSFRGAPETAGNIWANHRILRAKWNMGPNPQDPGERGAR